MIPYNTNVRCYGCRRPIKGELYVEKEARPDSYVPICSICEPTWTVLKQMQKRGLLETRPEKGVVLTQLAKLLYRKKLKGIKDHDSWPSNFLSIYEETRS